MNTGAPTNPSASPIMSPRGLCLVLAAATFLIFVLAAKFDYVDYDDGVYVYANQHVLRGLSVGGVRYAFTTIDGSSWMPVSSWFSWQFLPWPPGLNP